MRRTGKRTASRATRFVVTLLGVLTLGAAAAFAAANKPAKPDFALTGSPSTVTVAPGGTATYTETVTSLNGFSGTVSLSVSQLPKGATATFSPQQVSVPANGSAASTLTVTTASNTKAGSYTLKITGESANPKVTHDMTLTLVVQTVTTANFTLSASPSSQSTVQGRQATYTVTATPSGGFTGSVSLTAGGLPTGATASFSPNPVNVTSTAAVNSMLTITTSSSTPTGSYNITITGTSGSISRTTSVTLTVTPVVPFSISGSLTDTLYPGRQSPLNLTLTNPYNFTLHVTNLTVSITGTSNSSCAVSGAFNNFTVTQFSGTYPLTLGANQTTSLSAMSIPQARWPQVNMLNTSFNQDACKGVTLNLSYSGSGTD